MKCDQLSVTTCIRGTYRVVRGRERPSWCWKDSWRSPASEPRAYHVVETGLLASRSSYHCTHTTTAVKKLRVILLRYFG